MKITQDTRNEVQSHLAGEDKAWVYTSIAALAVTLVSIVLSLVFVFTGVYPGLYASLGVMVVSIIVFIGAIRKGVTTMTSRGVDLVEIGRQTINGEDRAPQTIAEVNLDKDDTIGYDENSVNTTNPTERRES